MRHDRVVVMYFLAWLCHAWAFGPVSYYLDNRYDARHLPPFLLMPQGRTFVYWIAVLHILCIISLIVFGFVRLRWYYIIGSVICAQFVRMWLEVTIWVKSPWLQERFGVAFFIVLGWVPTLILSLVVWFL